MANLHDTFKAAVFGEGCELADEKIGIFYDWEHVDFKRWVNDLVEYFVQCHEQYTEKEVKKEIRTNFEEDLKAEYKVSREKYKEECREYDRKHNETHEEEVKIETSVEFEKREGMTLDKMKDFLEELKEEDAALEIKGALAGWSPTDYLTSKLYKESIQLLEGRIAELTELKKKEGLL